MTDLIDPYLAEEPPGPVAPGAIERPHTTVETLPDGSQRAWLGDHLFALPHFRAEHTAWLEWLRAHGLPPEHVLSSAWVIRDPVARTISAVVRGPPDQPGHHVLDREAGVMVKHRHVVQLEAEPLPFPEPTP